VTTNPPRLQVVGDATFACVAADAIDAALPNKAGVLGVATGTTPERLYQELGRRSAAGELDLSAGTLVALDEYVGLSPSDPRSYNYYVRTRVAGPLGIDAGRVLVPDGADADPERTARAYEERIAALGGVDVQIVGIGTNGHLGFNEPGAEFASLTRVVELTEDTRRANARHFDGHLERVPAKAITQGLGTIMGARAIVLLARGSHKAPALLAALRGPICSATPASILQRHPCVTVIADTAAARLL
jgi:glucosamine-6-phosphate deaminase